MRDAIGGVFSIQVIIVFIVVVNGYLAFSVNYTRAYRVKNRIITILEQNEGAEGTKKIAVDEQIDDYTRQVGYTGDYSWTAHPVKTGGLDKTYYTVTTNVTIDIPIFREIIAGTFRVTGDTKLIYTGRGG